MSFRHKLHEKNGEGLYFLSPSPFQHCSPQAPADECNMAETVSFNLSKCVWKVFIYQRKSTIFHQQDQMGNKKCNCIKLNESQTKTIPGKNEFKCALLNIYQMSSFTLEKFFKLVNKIRYAVSPTDSQLNDQCNIMQQYSHSSTIHQSAYPIKLSSCEDTAHFKTTDLKGTRMKVQESVTQLMLK